MQPETLSIAEAKKARSPPAASSARNWASTCARSKTSGPSAEAASVPDSSSVELSGTTFSEKFCRLPPSRVADTAGLMGAKHYASRKGKGAVVEEGQAARRLHADVRSLG